MDLITLKVILVLSCRWNDPDCHADVPNDYVKAENNKNADIYMKMTIRMEVQQNVLDENGLNNTKHLAVLLKKLL